MYFNLYLDSLFFLEFFFDCMVLTLTGKVGRYRATFWGVFWGAIWGASIYCLALLIPFGNGVCKVFIGTFLTISGMIVVTFRPADLQCVGRLLATMLVCTFFLGGMVLFLRKQLMVLGWNVEGTLFFMGCGLFAYLVGREVLTKFRQKRTMHCFVFLGDQRRSEGVKAFWDTGNSLMEPISKEPVSVMDYEAVSYFFPEGLPTYFRVVPFSSVGREQGIMKCYEIPKIWVQCANDKMEFSHVWMAVSEDYHPSNGCHIILNPKILKKQEEFAYDF